MSDTHTVHDAQQARNRKSWVFGAVAVVVLAAIGVGGTHWWQQRQEPSQASAADCALAQKIIDQAQDLPEDKSAVTQWQQDVQNMRRTKMEDGYLGLQIAKYEGWAAAAAGDKAPAPPAPQQRKTADAANSHCKEADRTIRFPTIGS